MSKKGEESEAGPTEAELVAQGYEEAAGDTLFDAVQRYLTVGTLADTLLIVADACETRAIIRETPERDAKKWRAAAEALDDFSTAAEVEGAP